MPDLNDFHAFQSTSGGGGGGSGGSGGRGCGGGIFTWILVIAVILWIIGKLWC